MCFLLEFRCIFKNIKAPEETYAQELDHLPAVEPFTQADCLIDHPEDFVMFGRTLLQRSRR